MSSSDEDEDKTHKRREGKRKVATKLDFPKQRATLARQAQARKRAFPEDDDEDIEWNQDGVDEENRGPVKQTPGSFHDGRHARARTNKSGLKPRDVQLERQQATVTTKMSPRGLTAEQKIKSKVMKKAPPPTTTSSSVTTSADHTRRPPARRRKQGIKCDAAPRHDSRGRRKQSFPVRAAEGSPDLIGYAAAVRRACLWAQTHPRV